MIGDAKLIHYLFRGASAALLCFALTASAEPLPPTVPAWRNSVDKSAAEAALKDYSSNVIKCEWAGPDARVASLLPANLVFQFAVIGDSDVTNRVQKILAQTADAINPSLRKELEQFGLLNSTLQWIVRSTRPGVTNLTTYLAPRAHPAAFRESDFNLDAMTNAARRIGGNTVPFPVRIKLDYFPDSAPLGKAAPGKDYPDILPEETFTTPFGSAIVLRAPENKRKLKLSAAIYPPLNKKVKYVWQSNFGARFVDWSKDTMEMRDHGYACCTFNVSSIRTRGDIFVFALVDGAVCGPPAVISIYNPPLAKRTYKKGTLMSIEYLAKSRDVLYDIAPIWTPRAWKDEFIRDPMGRTLTVSRYIKGQFRPQTFAANGDLVLSSSTSGYPLSSKGVEYFVNPDTGLLDCREVGEVKSYPIGSHPVRPSGE